MCQKTKQFIYNLEEVDIIAEEQDAEDEDWETDVKFYE